MAGAGGHARDTFDRLCHERSPTFEELHAGLNSRGAPWQIYAHDIREIIQRCREAERVAVFEVAPVGENSPVQHFFMDDNWEAEIPKPARAAYTSVRELIDAFCADYLNEEYRDMCRKVAAALARKRPSPLSGGRANVWAAGITHAVGTVNFVFDRSKKPYVSSAQLSASYRVNQNTTSTRSKAIRTALKMRQFSMEWTLPSRVKDIPVLWYPTADGIVIHIR
ncbi:MAG: DUF6398 domain-containing protein [Thermoflexales bacterium]